MKRNLTSLTASLAMAACLSVGLATGPTSLVAPAAASGTNNQYQHQLQVGDTGTDVVALQYMLTARGYGPGVDGSFGPATLDAVKRFQSAKGLTVDGYVGNNTWNTLHVTTSATAGGTNDVKALQHLLKNKWDSSIVVDGSYGPHTTSAVRAFQSWAGLTPKNYMGDADWSRLLGAFERPNSTWCDYRGGEGYNWGTSTAIGAMEEAATGWSTSTYGKPSYGRISRRAGGYLSPHSSHRVGLDVDVAVFNYSKSQCTTTLRYYDSGYNRAATRAFMKRLYATGQVKTILFNDPTLINEGLSVWSSGHDDHLHVRFYEPYFTDSGSGIYYGR